MFKQCLLFARTLNKRVTSGCLELTGKQYPSDRGVATEATGMPFVYQQVAINQRSLVASRKCKGFIVYPHSKLAGRMTISNRGTFASVKSTGASFNSSPN